MVQATRKQRRWNYRGMALHTHKYATPFATLSGELRLTDSNRVILDGSARRFQAHRIYLRIAAAKRWAHHRTNVLRGQRPTAQHSAQLTAVNNTFRRVSLSLSRTHLCSLIGTVDCNGTGLTRGICITTGTGTNNRSVCRC